MLMLMTLLGVGLLAGVIINDSDDSDSAESGANESGNEDNNETVVEGTDGADLLFGTTGSENLLGGAGDDNIDARGGPDTIEGGAGDDTLDGGSAADNIFGGDGEDTLVGGNGDDFMRGNAGDDTLIDTRGADHLVGGQGDDIIIAAGILDEGAYEDIVQGRATPTSEAEVNALLNVDYTADQDGEGDTINAGAGDDSVLFGLNDTVTGGNGSDSFETGAWLSEDEQATITDFTADDDRVIYYYDEDEEEPELDVVTRANDDGGTDAFLVANGEEVVRLIDAGTTFNLAEHVALVARSG
ncbi:Hemolysin-type calcium-binding protein repeat protein (2 copies) [Phaeobacter piscinae]|uniref:Hemolysin-type calcium-binding protein repeat protein (2 copies) n=2 Tax=Phaeobacter piscinae TaxID=1580596 RepID=A0ABM6PDG2_9RHOB|nr:Hemolysin-type calcium-binding protein repeat protein (2 copies) [Phaeobacter piscinae]AUQ86283.1 Hemolysin-type calcium-binding protein repeat protein (2 copies) [Phaeobacter piscinae]AUR24166.1 Hemolysin-type calcium-binding protein repeat protein (2 copies) [Phaeobacter piscinae]